MKENNRYSWILYITAPLVIISIILSIAWINSPSIKIEMDNNTKEVSLAYVEIIDKYESEKTILERQLYLCNYKVDAYYNDCPFYCFDLAYNLNEDVNKDFFIDSCLDACRNKQINGVDE